MVQVLKTEDAHLLAILNHDVQELHHHIEPLIFKPHSIEAMEQLFIGMLENESMSAYVVYVDSEPAGYVILNIRKYPETPFRYAYTAIEIDQICVDSKFKGQGLGKCLVDFAKTFANEKGIHRIEMNFWMQNENSGQFFTSQGFKPFNDRMAFTCDENN